MYTNNALNGNQKIKPIETKYKGYSFRSRLEARWAVFFDALGIEWVYEKEGYELPSGEWYLPDFWFPSLNCFAEVKPGKFSGMEYKKCSQLDKNCLLLDVPQPVSAHPYYVVMADEPSKCSYEDYLSGNDEWRAVLQWSARKGRLWLLCGEHISDYLIDESPEVAAKSARFEHGEAPRIEPPKNHAPVTMQSYHRAPAVPKTHSPKTFGTRLLKILIHTTDDKNRDVRRVRRVHEICLSNPGVDSFVIIVDPHAKSPDEEQRFSLDFPHEKIRITDDLVSRLIGICGKENVSVEAV